MKAPVKIHPIYRSGSVERWHTNPDIPAQTLADHHGRVAQIILFFWPDADARLLYDALHHDCGELIVGDVPWPEKSERPYLRDHLEAAEQYARAEMGIDEIDAKNARLAFADRLEAYTYAALRAPNVTDEPEWGDALFELGQMADDLGISDRLVDWFSA